MVDLSGEMPLEEIARRFGAGELSAATLVCESGIEKKRWQPIESLLSERGLIPPKAPPSPTSNGSLLGNVAASSLKATGKIPVTKVAGRTPIANVTCKIPISNPSDKKTHPPATNVVPGIQSISGLTTPFDAKAAMSSARGGLVPTPHSFSLPPTTPPPAPPFIPEVKLPELPPPPILSITETAIPTTPALPPLPTLSENKETAPEVQIPSLPQPPTTIETTPSPIPPPPTPTLPELPLPPILFTTEAANPETPALPPLSTLSENKAGEAVPELPEIKIEQAPPSTPPPALPPVKSAHADTPLLSIPLPPSSDFPPLPQFSFHQVSQPEEKKETPAPEISLSSFLHPSTSVATESEPLPIPAAPAPKLPELPPLPPVTADKNSSELAVPAFTPSQPLSHPAKGKKNEGAISADSYFSSLQSTTPPGLDIFTSAPSSSHAKTSSSFASQTVSPMESPLSHAEPTPTPQTFISSTSLIPVQNHTTVVPLSYTQPIEISLPRKGLRPSQNNDTPFDSPSFAGPGDFTTNDPIPQQDFLFSPMGNEPHSYTPPPTETDNPQDQLAQQEALLGIHAPGRQFEQSHHQGTNGIHEAPPSTDFLGNGFHEESPTPSYTASQEAMTQQPMPPANGILQSPPKPRQRLRLETVAQAASGMPKESGNEAYFQPQAPSPIPQNFNQPPLAIPLPAQAFPFPLQTTGPIPQQPPANFPLPETPTPHYQASTPFQPVQPPLQHTQTIQYAPDPVRLPPPAQQPMAYQPPVQMAPAPIPPSPQTYPYPPTPERAPLNLTQAIHHPAPEPAPFHQTTHLPQTPPLPTIQPSYSPAPETAPTSVQRPTIVHNLTELRPIPLAKNGEPTGDQGSVYRGVQADFQCTSLPIPQLPETHDPLMPLPHLPITLISIHLSGGSVLTPRQSISSISGPLQAVEPPLPPQASRIGRMPNRWNPIHVSGSGKIHLEPAPVRPAILRLNGERAVLFHIPILACESTLHADWYGEDGTLPAETTSLQGQGVAIVTLFEGAIHFSVQELQNETITLDHRSILFFTGNIDCHPAGTTYLPDSAWSPRKTELVTLSGTGKVWLAPLLPFVDTWARMVSVRQEVRDSERERE